MARERTPSVLRKVAFDQFDSKLIAEAAEQGDALALEAFDLTARRLARALADAVAITSPEAIILFGGLAQAGDLLLEPTRRYLDEYCSRPIGVRSRCCSAHWTATALP